MLAQGTMGCMGILVCLGYTLRLLSRFKERFCVLAALTLMFTFFLATFPWPFLTAELPEPVHSVELSGWYFEFW
jgi:cellobiose-specific phosphotransferase system component IIC